MKTAVKELLNTMFRGKNKMRITRRQIRQIIREAREPMTPEYVRRSMMGKAVGPKAGQVFMDIALDGVMSGDYRAAANALMDGLWIDDPSVAADKELEVLLADARTEDDIVAIGAEWGTRHFRSH